MMSMLQRTVFILVSLIECAAVRFLYANRRESEASFAEANKGHLEVRLIYYMYIEPSSIQPRFRVNKTKPLLPLGI